MLILRLIFHALGLFILSTIVPLLLAGFTYWLIPAQFTIMVMGGLAALIILISLAYIVFVYALGIASIDMKSVSSSDSFDTSAENIQALIANLEAQGFKHLGNHLTDKVFSKEKSPYLVYLNETAHVVASLRIGDMTDASVSYMTIWENGQFVSTDSGDTGFVIHKPRFRYTTVKNGDAYRYHLEQVKAMKETAGKSIKIESLEQFHQLDRMIMPTSIPELSYTSVIKIIPIGIGAIIPLMAFGALAVEGAAFFKLLPESATISPLAPYIVFFVMSALVFQVGSRLLKLKPMEALDIGDNPQEEHPSLVG